MGSTEKTKRCKPESDLGTLKKGSESNILSHPADGSWGWGCLLGDERDFQIALNRSLTLPKISIVWELNIRTWQTRRQEGWNVSSFDMFLCPYKAPGYSIEKWGQRTSTINSSPHDLSGIVSSFSTFRMSAEGFSYIAL